MVRNLVVHGGAKLSRFIVVFILLSTLLVSLPTVAAAEKGSGDGEFQYPTDVAVDSEGNVYVADTSNYRIQKFTSNGEFITKWGSPGGGDGEFRLPVSVAVDPWGNVYVADNNNKRIQKFDSSGNFTTKWGSAGTGEGQFISPTDVAVDSSGNVCVVDKIGMISGNWTIPDFHIQKFDSSGGFLARWGPFGTGDGEIYIPTGIAVDSDDNVYVVDQWTDPNSGVSYSRIQKFDSSGNFTAKWGSYGTDPGQLRFPYDLAFDSSGNVSVVDWWIPPSFNPRIQKFDSEGGYITHWGSEGSEPGQFQSPGGIAVDSDGNVYVADTANHRIQKFTSAGQFIDYIPPLNQPPVADAGAEQTAIVGEEITFDGSNSDDEDGTIVSYEWDFGDGDSAFGNITTHSYSPNGTYYTVTLTVTDDDGATGTDNTTVTVQTPAEALQDLILYVEEMSLPRGIEKSLTSKIEAAISSLNRGQENAATNQLHAFINEVEAQRGKVIEDTQADELIAKAQQVIDNI